MKQSPSEGDAAGCCKSPSNIAASTHRNTPRRMRPPLNGGSLGGAFHSGCCKSLSNIAASAHQNTPQRMRSPLNGDSLGGAFHSVFQILYGRQWHLPLRLLDIANNFHPVGSSSLVVFCSSRNVRKHFLLLLLLVLVLLALLLHALYLKHHFGHWFVVAGTRYSHTCQPVKYCKLVSLQAAQSLGCWSASCKPVENH